MKSLKTNVYFKVGALIILVLLLLIPTGMIKHQIRDRERVQQSAINEVSQKWSGAQTLVGPFVTVPYTKYIKKYDEEEKKEKVYAVKDYIHILPTELNINGNVLPQKRTRGIYEIVVYNTQVDISGSFNEVDFSSFDIPKNQIHFDKAVLTLGINDLRGIEKQVSLSWNEETSMFNPGVVSNDIVSSGLNTAVNISDNDSSSYHFSLNLQLKGSQQLYFTPVGKITNVELTSPWQNPSFNGSFLPDSNNVTTSGFYAKWNVLHLNRNYPQSFIGSDRSVRSSSFGVDLLLPVDNYQKTYRAINYAILFIVLTYMVFFFIEILNKVYIHPVQYILVGIALVVFYTLLLSISEYVQFNIAFILSAIGTLVLIAGYVRAILKSGKLTALLTGILTILYTFIFVIIQLQDFALLIGSIGLFMILSLVMYYSRKIDWYNITMTEKPEIKE